MKLVLHKQRRLFPPTKTHFSIERITASEVTESIYYAEPKKKEKEPRSDIIFSLLHISSVLKGKQEKKRVRKSLFFLIFSFSLSLNNQKKVSLDKKIFMKLQGALMISKVTFRRCRRGIWRGTRGPQQKLRGLHFIFQSDAANFVATTLHFHPGKQRPPSGEEKKCPAHLSPPESAGSSRPPRRSSSIL